MGRTAFWICIDRNEEATTRRNLIEWLEEQFSIEFWYVLALASAPVLSGVFATEQIREAAAIGEKIQQSGRVRVAEPLFTYPTKWFLDPREVLLGEMLAKAGFAPWGCEP